MRAARNVNTCIVNHLSIPDDNALLHAEMQTLAEIRECDEK